MDTKQLETNVATGFFKAAMDNGLSLVQAAALYKLAEIDPSVLEQASQHPHFQNYMHDQWADSGKQQLKGTMAESLVNSGKDAWKTVALGTGGLGLMYLLGQNAKRREREQRAGYPMQVTYGGA